MRHFITSLLIIGTLTAQGQKALNNFKYLQVASQYSFQSSPDQYDFNELTLFLLKKNGFTVFKNGAVLPADFKMETCNALLVNMQSAGLLSHKLTVDFVDCSGTIIYSTEGVSRLKDNRKALHEALRNAFAPLDGFVYAYSPDDTAAYLEAAPISPEQERVTAAPSKSLQEIALVAVQDDITSYSHKTENLLYRLVQTGDGTYDIYRYDDLAGSMRKTGNGNYIVTLESHNGLGYTQNKNLVVEYDDQGYLKKLVFIPSIKN